MKLLLFGASGQLGHAWQTYFSDLDNKDIVVASYSSHQLDITRGKQVERALNEHQPDIIINCAAYTKVDEAEENRQKALEVNAVGVKKIAEICKKIDAKLIHFSTDYIFAGNKKDQKKYPKGYPENHKVNPVNWYGQTKWEGEKAIRNSGCKHLIMRISWLCGAYGPNFVKTMLRLAESHQQVKVVDDQTGSPTFADKLVVDTFKLIEQKKEGTYHHTSKGIISWADFAEEIFKISGKGVQINRIPSSEFPTKAKRPFYSKLDTAKIKQVESIKMEDWKTGLSRLLNKINYN